MQSPLKYFKEFPKLGGDFTGKSPMNIFDLIFIGVFLTTAATLIAISVTAVRGRRHRALKMLSALLVLVVAYLAVVVVVSLASPARVIHLREPQCFDDWCVSVENAQRAFAGTEASYTTTLRLFSRARRRPQRENGVSVYLLDELGRRYEPEPDSQAVPLNVLLNPGESVIVTRKFIAAAGAQKPGLVVAHGRFPGVFIIGDDQSLFHKQSVVRFE
jgi:hypothetical protein